MSDDQNPQKKTKVQIRRDALRMWWERRPWPCVMLAVDPGSTSGGAIIASVPTGMILIDTRAFNIHEGRGLESYVTLAFGCAAERGLPLLLLLEDWGRGGPRGLAQWIGLGEARGPWRREYMIQAKDRGVPAKVVLVTQTRWRSRIVPQTGAVSDGAWRPFTPDEWKDAAQEAARDHFISEHIPPADAAEAVCIGAYGGRSDEVAKKLGARHLAKWGQVFSPLEPVITESKKSGKAAAG